MKRILQSILGKFGFRLVRINDAPRPSEGLDPFFSLLQRLGFAPKHILDVGANRGNSTRTALKHFPGAHYTLVEPQDHLKAHIRDLLDRGCKIHWINPAAADKSRTMPMSISSRHDCITFILTNLHAEPAVPQPPALPSHPLT